MTLSPFYVDEDNPVKASIGIDGTECLHMKVKNTSLEPIAVTLTNAPLPTPLTLAHQYGTASAVAANVLTTIFTYTVPALNTLTLERVNVSGTDSADFTVLHGATVLDQNITTAANLNALFNFVDTVGPGYTFAAAQTILIKVIHNNASTQNFSARLQGYLTPS